MRSRQRSSQNPFMAVRLPLGGGCVGVGTDRDRSQGRHPAQPPAPACLSAQTPAEGKPWRRDANSPLQLGGGVRRWRWWPTASPERGWRPCPQRAFRCTVGERAAQLSAGACRGWGEDLEVPVALLPASRTSSGAVWGPHTPCHLPVIWAPDSASSLHEVESIGLA